MTIDMSQFYEVFFDESEELLAEAERLLLGLDLEDPDNEDLNAIFRAAHSIKGGAATFGFTDMAEITHVLENLLDKIRKNEMALTAEHVDAFLAAKDVLEMELDGHRNASEVDQEQVANVKTVLKSLSEAGGVAIKPTPTLETPAPEPVVEAKQEAPVESAPNPASNSDTPDGMTVFNIALPEVSEKDASNLQEELGLLGEVASNKQDDGRYVFSLTTDSSQDDIVSICSFILDPNDLVITTAESTPVPATSVAEAPVAADKPAPIVVATDEATPNKQTEKVQVDEEVGYGLFAEEGEDDVEEGYGFFAPFKPHDGAEKTELIGDDTPVSAEAATSQPEVDAAATEVKAPAKPAKNKVDKTAAAETTSIRVGVEKVDQLINLVGELVITQAMIDQRVAALDPAQNEKLIKSVTQLTRNTRDLQESVMSIRMMPMDFVFHASHVWCVI